jgi:hypothetical protein
MGKREKCAISGGPAHVEIFVSHVAKHTGIEPMKSFLEKEQIPVIDIVLKSNANSRFDSFKITVDKKFKDHLCGDAATAFWPENIYCRQFFHPRSRPGLLNTEIAPSNAES